MKRGIVYAGMAGAVWGLVFLVPALLPEFSPLLLSCARFILYGAVSALLILPDAKRLLPQLTRRDVVTLVKLALLGNLIYYMLLAASIQWVGIAVASLIIGVLPLTISWLGRSDAGAVPLTRLIWPLLLVLAGMLCINLEALSGANGGQPMAEKVLGIACAIGALACWTGFATANARYLKHSQFTSSEWSSLWGVTTGVLGLLIWGAASALSLDAVHIDVSDARWQGFWAINLACAVVGSWFGNRMWNAASRRLPLTLSGQLIVFETLFALFYGFVFLQRWPTALETLAVLLLLSGVSWAVRRHAPGRAALA
ncbi:MULTISPECIES: DMT family transporter [unclassified Pseudomonas]|uniref:DMT family transporter n=1 Tax=unclassified Pseudomonas TaxID=196821 RepID=UPI0014760A1A|nr:MULTISPECIES: DMT family transporter [unclassified Pseudomonas]NMY39056.1 DMT family transporter [Pseudomonas sp. WS 5078]NMY61866.1 DMT family transporter [Pseudomonas sp. WS 5354]NMY74792.1 DMT family transporter [Pseudomonas sp. WS 5071]